MDLLIVDHGDGGDIRLFEDIYIPRSNILSPSLGYGFSFGGGFIVLSDPPPPYETGNADIHTDSGVGTAIYLSLFTGTAWNDVLLPNRDAASKFGEVERLLNEPISVGSMSRIQQAAAAQLTWLKDEGLAESITVAVRNPLVGRIELDITATQPNSPNVRYRYLWDQREQQIVMEARNNAFV